MRLTHAQFRERVLEFYDREGRHHLPWRENPNPYRVLVSEVMLQQTQVDRVISFFLRWMEHFPSIHDLARANQREVLRLWQGLGYNRRALALHRSAQEIVQHWGGEVPPAYNDLLSLPGIGPYTAAAIRNFAFQEWTPFIDTNIRRVFLYHFFSREHAVPDERILAKVARVGYERDPRVWGYALMDYGAMLKKTLKENPNRRSRSYVKQSSFRGSHRELRSALIRILIQEGSISSRKLLIELRSIRPKLSRKEYRSLLSELTREGFIEEKDGKVSLKE